MRQGRHRGASDRSGSGGAPKRERAPLPPGFGAIWTTVAIDLIGFGVVLPILPRYAEDLRISPTVIGIVVASFSVAQMICSPLLGRLSDRIGRKPVLLLSLVGTAVGSLVTGLAGTVWLLLLGRVIDGGSGASVSVAQAAVADVAAPDQRPRLLGLLGAAFGVGFVIGPAIGALAALGGRHLPFYVAAAISGVNALVAIRRLPETHPHRTGVPDAAGAPIAGVAPPATAAGAAVADAGGVHGSAADAPGPAVAHASARADLEDLADLTDVAGPPQSSGGHAGHGGHRGAATGASGSGGTTGRRGVPAGAAQLVLVAFVALFAFSGFETTFSLLLHDRLGLTLGSTADVFVVVGLVLVFVQAGLIHPAHAALGHHRTLRLGLTLNGVGLFLLAVDGRWLTMVPALLGLVLGQGLLTPTLSSEVAGQAAPQDRGRVLGYQQSAGALARVVGPLAAGALYGHVGHGAPYLVGGCALVVAHLLVPRRAPATPAPAEPARDTAT